LRYLGGGRKVDLGPGRAAVNLTTRVYGRLVSDTMASGARPVDASKLKVTGLDQGFTIKRRST